MNFILSLCLLSGVALDLSTAAAFGGRNTLEMAAQEKSPRATGDNGQANNMTVAFVPLISIIANLLPRFFTRYATMPPATVQQARSINVAGKEPMDCEKLEHVGMKLPDEFSQYHYYQCHLSKPCFKATQELCFQVKRHTCKPYQTFNFEKQKCFSPYFPRKPY